MNMSPTCARVWPGGTLASILSRTAMSQAFDCACEAEEKESNASRTTNANCPHLARLFQPVPMTRSPCRPDVLRSQSYTGRIIGTSLSTGKKKSGVCAQLWRRGAFQFKKPWPDEVADISACPKDDENETDDRDQHGDKSAEVL